MLSHLAKSNGGIEEAGLGWATVTFPWILRLVNMMMLAYLGIIRLLRYAKGSTAVNRSLLKLLVAR